MTTQSRQDTMIKLYYHHLLLTSFVDSRKKSQTRWIYTVSDIYYLIPFLVNLHHTSLTIDNKKTFSVLLIPNRMLKILKEITDKDNVSIILHNPFPME